MADITSISPAMCTRGRSLGQALLSPDGDWVACSAGGSIIVVPASGGPEQVVAVDPRPGQFDWLPDSAGLVYASGRAVCRVPLTGGQAEIVLEADGPVAAPAVSSHGRIAYVVDDRDVFVDGVRLTTDNDFAFDPAWSPDGRTVAWHEWDVPDMPWDGGRIVTRDADGAGPKSTVAGGSGVAVQQPRFSSQGTLGYLCDATGWLTVWVDGRPVLDEQFEHGDPAWGQGQRSWCWSPDGTRIALHRNESGFGRLVVVDVETGEVEQRGKAVHRSVSWARERIAAVRSGGTTPQQLVVYEDERRVLAHGPVLGFAKALVEPLTITWDADDAMVLHGLVYEPTLPSGRLLVQIHGGPVGQHQVIFDAKTAFWLDRGWTVFVPDFRGSTGWGRAYQQAINGQWGEADIADVAAGVRSLGRDPARTAVIGGSSGGMAVLLLLARHPELFACGVASFPVVDLVALAKTTHRFEAHANDRLVGSKREQRRRSPIAFADHIDKPLLVFHGLSDEVVPPAQSRKLVRRLRARGVDIEHVEYAGEGHGIRQPANVEDQLRRTQEFLDRSVLGFLE